MPVLDMPLKDLQRYKGINPCPRDHTVYWTRALAEMKAVEPNVELRKASFQSPVADCYDLYFTGVRNARIHAKMLKPKVLSEKAPAVLQFHGYNCNSGDWLDKVAYAASGFVVVAMDVRGQGFYSEDTGGPKTFTSVGHFIRGIEDENPDNMIMRHVYLDTAELAQIVMDFDFVDERRVGAMGASQGGALTIACASLEPSIKRVAPMYPFLCDFKRVWDMDLAKDAYSEIKHYFRWFDPAHQREQEFFERLGYLDLQFLSPRIKGQVLMATGLQDNICPPSTQFAMYNNIRSIKRHIIYPDFGHEYIPQFGDLTYQFMLEFFKY